MVRMSYAVYKTQAIVLRSVPDREANADVVFLTRDLGKIVVRAQAARKLESKHRMQLSRYNDVMIDVVRGAHIWRLTGIHQVAQHNLFKNNQILHAFHRAAMLAEHLIRGEESHPELFDFFVGLLEYIDSVIPDKGAAVSSERDPGSRAVELEIQNISEDKNQSLWNLDPGLDCRNHLRGRREDGHLAGLELFAVIKVLDHLGYWSGESFPETPTDEILQKCVDQKTELVAMVNEGIRGSQIV